MPLEPCQASLKLISEEGSPPILASSDRFRHFAGGSLALASLNLACRTLVPVFPQRSPPWLLTTAACGGLRSTPDCRTRRAHLHLSYSCTCRLDRHARDTSRVGPGSFTPSLSQIRT